MTSIDNPTIHINPRTSLPTAMNFWEVYLLDQGRSEYTIKAFLGDMQLLGKFLPPDAEIGKISSQDLVRFIEWLENGRGRNIPCSPKSLSRRITTIKSFFRWLVANGRIFNDPAVEIAQPTVISPLPEVLTEAEMNKALDAARNMMMGRKPDSRPLLLLILLLDTGIKKSECLNIKLNHIQTEGSEPFLIVRYPDQKDRNKERKIRLSNEFVHVLLQYSKEYQPTDALFPWSPRRLEYILEDISKEVGLGKHLSFSMCRWNCALSDLKQGLDRDLIRQKLGISKIQWREINLKLKELARSQD